MLGRVNSPAWNRAVLPNFSHFPALFPSLKYVSCKNAAVFGAHRQAGPNIRVCVCVRVCVRMKSCVCSHRRSRAFCLWLYRRAHSRLPFLFSFSADLGKRTTGNLKKKRRRNRLFDPHLNSPERDKAEFSIGPLPFSPGGKEEKKNKRYLYDSSC